MKKVNYYDSISSLFQGERLDIVEFANILNRSVGLWDEGNNFFIIGEELLFGFRDKAHLLETAREQRWRLLASVRQNIKAFDDLMELWESVKDNIDFHSFADAMCTSPKFSSFDEYFIFFDDMVISFDEDEVGNIEALYNVKINMQ